MIYFNWFIKEVLCLYFLIFMNICVVNKDMIFFVGGGFDGLVFIFVVVG